jgi:hypothetical protein
VALVLYQEYSHQNIGSYFVLWYRIYNMYTKMKARLGKAINGLNPDV